MTSKKKKNSFSFKMIAKALLDSNGMSNRITDDIQPKRTVYYSSILVLSSAALAFLGQSSTKVEKDIGLSLLLLSIIFFGSTIVCLLLIYFLQVIHGIQWGKVMQVYEKIFEVAPLKNVIDTMNHDYFKQNPEAKESFRVSMFISARLFKIEIILDLVLLILVLGAVILYCSSLLILIT